MSNILVAYGDAVKSNEQGLLEGRAIVFGSPESPDSSRYKDYFSEETFVNRKNTFEVMLGFEHGDGYSEDIGEATITKTADGWEAVAQLDMDNPIVQDNFDDIKAGKYGFSTGALPHYVKRQKQKNGTNHIKRWVVGELSITKTPAEKKAIIREVKYAQQADMPDDAGDMTSTNPSLELVDILKDFISVLLSMKVNLSDEAIEKIVEKIPQTVKSDVNGELETELAKTKQQLADLEVKFGTSEVALQEANQQITRLSFLAGVEQTLKDK